MGVMDYVGVLIEPLKSSKSFLMLGHIG